MSYSLANKTEKQAEVVNELGKLLGYVQLTENETLPWAGFDSDWSYVQVTGRTAEQAAYNLVQYLNTHRS